jgi:hypothetical protein
MPASFCNHGSQFEGLSLLVLSLLAFPGFRKREGGVDFVTGIIQPVPLERELGVDQGDNLGSSSRARNKPRRPGLDNPELHTYLIITYRNFSPCPDGCLPGE